MDVKQAMEKYLDYHRERDKAERKAIDAMYNILENIMEATSIAFYLFTGKRDAFCMTPPQVKDSDDATRYINEWNSKIDMIVEYNERYGLCFPPKVVEYIKICRFESFEQAFEKVGSV